jgi:hypothetical protein
MNAVLVAPYRVISFSISARDFSTETVVPSANPIIISISRAMRRVAVGSAQAG